MKITGIIVLLTVLFTPLEVFAAKETVVLMPLQIIGVDKNYKRSMETALVEGLQRKYKVFAGDKVQKKVREIYRKESARTEAGKECDETICFQQIAVSFQSELIATAQVIKSSGGYVLSLSIRNIFDDIAVYSKSIPCKGCDEFAVIDQLKILAGGGRKVAPSAPTIAAPSGVGFDLGDLDSQANAQEAEKEKAAKAEAAVKRKWKKYLDDMKKAYAQVEAYERRDISKELKVSAWEKFLGAYSEDDTYSGEDESLREKALARIERIRTAKAGGGSVDGMALVSGGCYQMGDTFGDGYSSEKPVHEVCLDDFYIDKTEVTQSAYERVIGSNPSRFKGSNNPVERVSWNDAVSYCEKEDKRLPTEAEWEYAARSGGKKEKYAGGGDIDSVAWYRSNSGSKTHPVGQKSPNGLGLYDMSGNVWELVSDRYSKDYYGKSSKNNPVGPSAGRARVLRGGSWFNIPRHTRSSIRLRDDPSGRFNYFGFRCARAL